MKHGNPRFDPGEDPRRVRWNEGIKSMSKSLVIVESPAKAKTINKYLGSDYTVEASIGHIMDLPKNDIGVELLHRTFEPTLIVSPGKEKIVDRLKKLAAKADSVYLAPDPDREGEAIAAHLAMQLKPVLKAGASIQRVTFNEITQKAVKEAFTRARDVNENLVGRAANTAGTGRLVGYQISPLLWDKVRRGLSAGGCRRWRCASSLNVNVKSMPSSRSSIGPWMHN